MGKVMCIDSSLLREYSSMQKSTRVETLLNSSVYIDEAELKDSYERGLREWKFSTIVRSMSSNKVVYHSDGDKRKFYYTFGKVDVMPHKGYDLVMYLSSLAIRAMIKPDAPDDEICNVMFNGSIFNVLGLYYDGLLDPILLSNIIIRDSDFDGFITDSLADGYSVCDIRDINEYGSGNIQAFLDEIVITKSGGDSDERQ